MTTQRTSRPYKNRTRDSFPEGTKVYCWKFSHPKFGIVGGRDDEDWSDKKEVIQSMMSHCQWPSELIEAIA